MSLKYYDRVSQIVGLIGLLVLCGCSRIDDAGVFIARSNLFACADVNYGAIDEDSGQVRAEVVAEVYEYAGGTSQQALIPMTHLRTRGSALTYSGSKPLTVPRDCVTRLSGDFLFEANAGGMLGVVSKTRHVETDVSRLINIGLGPPSRPGFGATHEVVVSLPCPLRVHATVHLTVGARVNPDGDGVPTTFLATVEPERIEFAPGVTRQVATLLVEADDPDDEFGVIATVTGRLEVVGDMVDTGCSARCVGINCNTCEEQYEDCGDIGRAYCGVAPTSCDNWPDGF